MKLGFWLVWSVFGVVVLGVLALDTCSDPRPCAVTFDAEHGPEGQAVVAREHPTEPGTFLVHCPTDELLGNYGACQSTLLTCMDSLVELEAYLGECRRELRECEDSVPMMNEYKDCMSRERKLRQIMTCPNEERGEWVCGGPDLDDDGPSVREGSP